MYGDEAGLGEGDEEGEGDFDDEEGEFDDAEYGEDDDGYGDEDEEEGDLGKRGRGGNDDSEEPAKKR